MNKMIIMKQEQVIFESPLKRSKSIRFGTYMSSDYRNRFALDFGCGATFKPLYSSIL